MTGRLFRPTVLSVLSHSSGCGCSGSYTCVGDVSDDLQLHASHNSWTMSWSELFIGTLDPNLGTFCQELNLLLAYHVGLL